MWHAAFHSAKRRNLEFSIDILDIVIPKICPVLGIELVWDKGNDFCPSLDRKDNAIGYVRENIMVISGRANRIKSDATQRELEAILRYVKS
jgi:hypothetical protein